MFHKFKQVKSKAAVNYQKLRGQGNVAVLVRGAGSSFLVRGLGMGLAFMVQLVAARLLGLENYGNYAYVLAWMTMMSILGMIGFDTATLRFVSEYVEKQEWGKLLGFLRFSKRVVLIASVGAAFCLSFAAWLFKDNLSVELLYGFWIASLLLIVQNFAMLQENRLLALRNVLLGQLPLAVLRPFFILVGCIGIAVWVSNLGVAIFIAVALAASVLSLGVISVFLKQTLPSQLKGVTESSNSKYWLQTALTMTLISSVHIIISQSDVVMVGALVGAKETGLYSVANRLASLLVFTLIAVNSVLASQASALYAKQSLKELQRIVSLGIKFVFFSTLPIAIVYIIWGSQVLRLFGEEFSASYSILIVLTLGQLVNALSGPVALLLNMTGHQNDTAKILMLTATVNITLNAILIPKYGAMGAAVATAFANGLWNIVMVYAVWKRIKIISFFMPDLK
ncbi:MAG: flippase [Nostocales cyanobacterium 94392]|nr:flippase [Nostocales cyanobacterium 94392]